MGLFGKFRNWRTERHIKRIVRRHEGLNEEMVLMADELSDEIKVECPDQESKIAYCQSHLDGKYWGNNVLLASFGEDIFAEALRRKLAKPSSKGDA